MSFVDCCYLSLRTNWQGGLSMLACMMLIVIKKVLEFFIYQKDTEKTRRVSSGRPMQAHRAQPTDFQP